MNAHPHPRFLDVVLLVVALLIIAATAGPAHAQYGGGQRVFVDPVRVPVGTSFSVFGTGCPAGAEVDITIDTVAGVIGTTVADPAGVFSVASIPAPIEFVAGTTYTVRASCLGLAATTILDAVCADGTDPVNGSCASPGGSGGTPTTSTGAGVPAGGTGTGTDTIAFTGAGRAVQLLQLGTTLVGLGMIFLLFTRRRHSKDEPSGTLLSTVAEFNVGGGNA